ncbi:formylglycine-generating sulfatase-like enzyme [Candidatus Scalindua japonica]|uniref:Formylglycine-generating sulfatase-like enzyme n=2 Tax=Candidatus Scalindua japonica TaxID=1284222 RepID=A0A286U2R1_9BACT|nr:formylglycine-generating sulfatase-like enzyme [Candidatus Scalindua japonica]
MEETGFLAFVDEELIKGPGRFAKIHKRIQGWLLQAITADTKLSPTERSSAGTALAKIGDPRIDPEKWFLPKEEDFGFIRIEAGGFIMGSDNPFGLQDMNGNVWKWALHSFLAYKSLFYEESLKESVIDLRCNIRYK